MFWLPDDTFPRDKISAELNRVFVSVHMNEPVSSTVDEITAFMNGRNMKMAVRVVKTVKKEVEEKGLKLSNIDGGGEGKSKAITSCKYLEERCQECSKKEGVVLETSVETLGVDLRTRTPSNWGAKEKARRKKGDVRFLIIRKIEFSRKIHEDWGEKAVENGLGSRGSVARTGCGHRAYRWVQVEEANGSSSTK